MIVASSGHGSLSHRKTRRIALRRVFPFVAFERNLIADSP